MECRTAGIELLPSTSPSRSRNAGVDVTGGRGADVCDEVDCSCAGELQNEGANGELTAGGCRNADVDGSVGVSCVSAMAWCEATPGDDELA